MATKDLIRLAEEIKIRPILTEYLTPAKVKNTFVCLDKDCKNGSGDDGTGATVSKDNLRLLCGKCGKGFSNIDVIANYLGVGTSGKDFVEVIKFGCQIFGLPFADDSPVKNSVETFERLAEAQNNLPSFVKNQGGKWRGLSLHVLQHYLNAGFLPNIYFPKTGKELPAVIIPNDSDNLFARSIIGKDYRNFDKTDTTTIFLPDSDSFDVIVTEGAINGASILQAWLSVYGKEPNFAIIASGGTSGNKNVLERLQKLKASGKNFRAVIAYDKDSNNAGQNAAVNLSKMLINASIDACTVDITKMQDIDLNDVLRNENGTTIIINLVLSAVNFAQVELEKIAREEEREKFGDTIAEYFSTDFSNFVDKNKRYKNRKTGFSNLDKELQGLPSSIVIIAGVPAVGKTSFTLQFVEQMARQGEPAIFITLEQSKGFIHSKILAREINQIEGYPKLDVLPMTAKHVMQGDIYEHANAYRQALKNFSAADFNFRIWQIERPDIDEILIRLETFCNKYPNAIIALDYFQLFGTGAENTKAKLDEVMHKIINFRRKFDVTFLIVSSINRAGYNVDSGLSSLKETGGLEYGADFIFFLQLLTENGEVALEGDIFKAAKQTPRPVQFKCLKNRYGGLFDIGFWYYSAAEIFKPNLEYGEYIDHQQKKKATSSPDDDKNYGES